MLIPNSSVGGVKAHSGDDHAANGHTPFEVAMAELRGARLRRELQVREIAAPDRIAPQSIAFAAGVTHGETHPSGQGDDSSHSPYGAGRLILMHDPASSEDWGSPFRIVCFAQAPLEVEIGTDPFIADVAWSWLIDALESRGANYTYASGTATKTLSTGFGTLEQQGDAAQIEIRASWTPLPTDALAHPGDDARTARSDESVAGYDFAAHAEAWGELLCLLAGLPHEEGVASLGAHRARRGKTA